MNQPATISSGNRKYSRILAELVAKNFCRVECSLADTRTIIEGVKQEKVRWKRSGKWPKGMALKIDIMDSIEHTGLLVKMIEDTSVNNL